MAKAGENKISGNNGVFMISTQQQSHQQNQQERQQEHQNQRLAESARYALLRRLAPALRHNMAGALQPLAMMSILLEKRLQNPSPDLSAVVKNSSQLNKASGEAAKACMDVMTWLAPSASDFISITKAIEDATKLVTTELSFKGLTVVNDTADLQAEMSRSLIRNVFMAALMALTDAAMTPTDVLIQARLDAEALVLTISLQPTPGELSNTDTGSIEPPYRKLDWADVRVLAEVESVQLAHTCDKAELRFASRLLRLD